MPNRAGDNEIGFFVYHTDWLFYKQLKAEGRIKTGEMTQYMRKCFRDFLERHRTNPVRIKPEDSAAVIADAKPELNNQEAPASMQALTRPYKPASIMGVVGPEGDIHGR